jgi:hypothetical protein
MCANQGPQDEGPDSEATGAWTVSIIATGMPAEKQQQFRADIKANSKPWESEIEFAMPGELKLYRDYKLTDEPEYASESDKKDATPETKKANNFALNPKNKDGYDSKWQHAKAAAARTTYNTDELHHLQNGPATRPK